MNEKTLIRIFTEKGHEAIEDYEPSAFGGVIPSVGDLIVDPGVPQGRSRDQPQNRDIHEVVARYFLPGTMPDDLARIALIVTTRKGRQDEANIF